MDMNVNQNVIVTFYRLSGKYYSDCEITVTNEEVLSDRMPSIVIERQTALNDGWVGNYHVVVRNRDDSNAKEHAFCDMLITADKLMA